MSQEPFEQANTHDNRTHRTNDPKGLLVDSFRKIDFDLFDFNTGFLDFFLQIRLNCLDFFLQIRLDGLDFKTRLLNFLLQPQFGFAQITLGN